MKRNLEILLILLTGVALLHITVATDLYLHYVKPGMRPLLIGSGALLVLLGFTAAARDGFPFPRPRPGDGHGGHGGGQHGHGPGVAWLLWVPVLGLLFFAPPALGAYTAARDADRPVAKAADSAYPPLPESAVVPLALKDFAARAVWDTGGSLRGRTVRLTGFVTPGKDGVWHVSRLTVTCCAADAQVLKVAVHGAAAPPADSWVSVTGTWRPQGRVGTDSARPALDAAEVAAVPEPRNPYRDTAGG
ncbi:TIGR03943 family protein [Streptomyces capparidis]